jgi:hypothetical protein
MLDSSTNRSAIFMTGSERTQRNEPLQNRVPEKFDFYETVAEVNNNLLGIISSRITQNRFFLMLSAHPSV